jgi:uncharacterized protein
VALTKRVPREQPFEIRPSPIAGSGAFATRRLRAGARIAEYTGERISSAEADRRYDDEKMARTGGHYTLLFIVDKRTVIDAAVGGNDSRFINHCCDPNCEAVIEDRRVFIDAVRAILPGEELHYDYSYEREPGQTRAAARAMYPCHCGVAACRGTILAPPPRRRRRRPGARKTAGKARKPRRRGTTRSRA